MLFWITTTCFLRGFEFKDAYLKSKLMIRNSLFEILKDLRNKAIRSRNRKSESDIKIILIKFESCLEEIGNDF